MSTDRLIKFLNLTESTNDGEALSAIRKANELIKSENKTWSAVVHGQQAHKCSSKAPAKTLSEIWDFFKDHRHYLNQKEIEAINKGIKVWNIHRDLHPDDKKAVAELYYNVWNRSHT